ncbi:hypothetical protein PZN02_000882 [Sinorhizobium garamanticum]|uniref:Uncharacterized protein n=1 Tax=Sinorhizobium garamanticum TaxID=680247 RepID=A0ABY8DBY0_9HYPH|nr:hypothetical protein [Sinorhizobium garamanticum]WEX88400.1 hypothetical protein PZN02_000882 [Sinorhizobium garamanticum]
MKAQVSVASFVRLGSQAYGEKAALDPKRTWHAALHAGTLEP